MALHIERLYSQGFFQLAGNSIIGVNISFAFA
jgi:hypothetical protein